MYIAVKQFFFCKNHTYITYITVISVVKSNAYLNITPFSHYKDESLHVVKQANKGKREADGQMVVGRQTDLVTCTCTCCKNYHFDM